MADLVLVLVVLAAAVGARWLLRDLRTVPEGSTYVGSPLLVSVVIPARDEEESLPAVLRSLHESTVDVRDVVVVDDDSQDATAAAARSAGAVVLTAGTPPAGWTGKAWACHVGARATAGDLLLFLDADTVLSPDALAGLLHLHGRQGGLVSVQPFHHVVRPYEQLSAYFNAVSVMASAAFARRRGAHPMAFGPCLLTSRADYERAGGHVSVRGEILDDVRLAAAYDRAGLPVTCSLGGRSVRMRSYPGGVRQLADGWTKNVASGASAASPLATAASVAWVGSHHAVAVGTVTAALAASGLSAPWAHGHAALWVAAWAAVALQLRWVLRRVGSFRWWSWLFFPVPLLAFDVLFVRSAAVTTVRRAVRWRGREVVT